MTRTEKILSVTCAALAVLLAFIVGVMVGEKRMAGTLLGAESATDEITAAALNETTEATGAAAQTQEAASGSAALPVQTAQDTAIPLETEPEAPAETPQSQETPAETTQVQTAPAETQPESQTVAASSGYEVGDQFPDFTMTDENGEEVSLSAYRGKVLYLNFFTTWCSYCYYELPDLEELQEQYGDQLQVVLVDLEETTEETDAYAEAYDVTLPIHHVDSWTIGDYEITGVPESIVLDADGIIADRLSGMADADWMEDAVEAALQ